MLHTDARGINGLEGTFEFAIDAPWRMEPHRTGVDLGRRTEYGPIPIQISIHDAMFAGLDNIYYERENQGGVVQLVPKTLPANLVSLGKFSAVRIRECGASFSSWTVFRLTNLFEIELSGFWTNNASAPPPTNRLCRLWAGEDPSSFENIAQTSEWHALLWYAPENPNPGTTLCLEIEVLLDRQPWNSDELPVLLKSQEPSRLITLRNYVRVFLALEPLPRFDNRWLYGDLHYHSQGTDNDVEAAYNYRGVIRAMGAMGLDFVLATEHASASEQFIDADLHLNLVEEFIGNVGSWLGIGGSPGLEEDDATSIGGVLRDSDVRRHEFSHGLIHGERGANREAALQGGAGRRPQGYLSHGVLPQMFLGGEIDAIPELSKAEIGELPTSSLLQGLWRPPFVNFGNGLLLDPAALCKPGGGDCHPYQLFEPTADGYLLRDFQGLETIAYGREHLVYFPNRSALHVTNGSPPATESTFIPSSTGKYGGATRRLADPRAGSPPLLPEIERKGVAFVAHHLNACNDCSNGPDGFPWTGYLLNKAWSSPAILGLEFWNEDGRHKSRVCSHLFCRDNNYTGQELGYERDESFDLLGYVPEELRDRALPLAEVRHGFVSGRFAGGEFALTPFTVPDGKWENRDFAIEFVLHNGAYDWDQMNLRGLDILQTRELAWLPSGEPRRFFMAGGSDAHGDLNYRRVGYFLGATEANDTAMGKPRNLVFTGPPAGDVLANDPSFGEMRPHTQEQIVGGLRSGRFCVTDGPALRIAIDRNNNFQIDDADIQMGEVFRYDGKEPIILLAEWISTVEFGPVRKVDLYVGVNLSGRDPTALDALQPRVYAPANHGPRSPFFNIGMRGYVRDDGLQAGPSEASAAYAFISATVLDLDRYEFAYETPGDRFFVRAFAEAGSEDPAAQAVPRYVFTNPIWIIRKETLGPVVGTLLPEPPAQTPQLTSTFTNPRRNAGDAFGYSVAGMGTDKVLIGAPYANEPGADNAGAAFSFHVNGTLLTTFTNPAPATADYFGWSVAAVGRDKVLVGAYGNTTGGIGDTGAAYLFDLNGNLLTTFTSPTPQFGRQFGYAVTGVGSDKVLIGEPIGAAYLFTTDGALLKAVVPDQAFGSGFGRSVATVGGEHLIIGSPQMRDPVSADVVGGAQLFHTNGTAQALFRSPTPGEGDEFGRAVTGVGADKVLIGTHRTTVGGLSWAGAAYLYNTNGTLLTDFTNPAPTAADFFGIAVAAAGRDKVLIGAHGNDTGATDAGAAYLFSLARRLLTTITNPVPNLRDQFGNAVAAFTGGRTLADGIGGGIEITTSYALIGAPGDDTVGTDAGAAYLYALEPVPETSRAPRVTATRNSEGQVVILFSGALQHSSTLDSAFADVPQAMSPYFVPRGSTTGFYRIRSSE